MKQLRLAPAALAAALALALVAPSVSLACEARAHRCPGMPPELAALCHQAGSLAPDCCRHERPTPGRSAGNELQAPTLSAVLGSASVAIAATAATPSGAPGSEFSRDASFHELGLFTLHAVFRI